VRSQAHLSFALSPHGHTFSSLLPPLRWPLAGWTLAPGTEFATVDAGGVDCEWITAPSTATTPLADACYFHVHGAARSPLTFFARFSLDFCSLFQSSSGFINDNT
jgi:hypothetical protein